MDPKNSCELISTGTIDIATLDSIRTSGPGKLPQPCGRKYDHILSTPESDVETKPTKFETIKDTHGNFYSEDISQINTTNFWLGRMIPIYFGQPNNHDGISKKPMFLIGPHCNNKNFLTVIIGYFYAGLNILAGCIMVWWWKQFGTN
jgi:hypothetical protein